MKEFRITKYDPKHRDSSGYYMGQDEWTCFSEVGTNVSKEAYELVESNYIASAIDLVSGTAFTVTRLEDAESKSGLCEGKKIEEEEIVIALRGMLRSEYWCRLESASAFIHIGWDYYMYIGVPEDPEPSIIEGIQQRNLFVERFTSPYHPEECEG